MYEPGICSAFRCTVLMCTIVVHLYCDVDQMRTLYELGSFSPQALATTAQALVAMRVRLRPPWRAAFYEASLPLVCKYQCILMYL